MKILSTQEEAEAIYTKNKALARFFLRRYGGALLALGASEEDVLQDVRLQLWCAALTYDKTRPEKFSTWAGLRVRNRLRNMVRDLTRGKRFAPLPTVSLSEPFTDSAAEDALTYEDVVASDESTELSACAGIGLDALRKKLRPQAVEVLNMRIDGLRQAEIAKCLGVSQPHVSQSLKRIAVKFN